MSGEFLMKQRYGNLDGIKLEAVTTKAFTAVQQFQMLVGGLIHPTAFFLTPAGSIAITADVGAAASALGLEVSIHFHHGIIHRPGQGGVQFSDTHLQAGEPGELPLKPDDNAGSYGLDELAAAPHLNVADAVHGFVVDGLVQIIDRGSSAEVRFQVNINDVIRAENLFFGIKTVVGEEAHAFQSDERHEQVVAVKQMAREIVLVSAGVKFVNFAAFPGQETFHYSNIGTFAALLTKGQQNPGGS
jgi:hypothetical protein